VYLHPIHNRVSFCFMGLYLVIVKHATTTPLGVVHIEATYDYGRELGVEFGKEICDGIGSARGIEIIDAEGRATREGNSYSKERI
jgi:hypothetical protein